MKITIKGFVMHHSSSLLIFSLLMTGTSSLFAATLNFTDPGGNDTTGNTTVDQSKLADLGGGYTQNYSSTAAAFADFNSGSAIVWTFDNQTSAPHTNLGNFSNNLGSLTYSKSGPYSTQLSSYTNDLDISLVDSEGTMRFTTPSPTYADISDHVLAGNGNPNGTQTLTLTFSENVAAIALTFTVPRPFAGTVYDQAIGGTEIGTFSFTGGGTQNLIWSAYEEGASQGIGRVELARSAADTGGDYRMIQFGIIPIPEPSSLILLGIGSLLVAPMALRNRRSK